MYHYMKPVDQRMMEKFYSVASVEFSKFAGILSAAFS